MKSRRPQAFPPLAYPVQSVRVTEGLETEVLPAEAGPFLTCPSARVHVSFVVPCQKHRRSRRRASAVSSQG